MIDVPRERRSKPRSSASLLEPSAPTMPWTAALDGVKDVIDL